MSHATGTTDPNTLDLATLAKRVAALERQAGKQGSGACICKGSPAWRWRECWRTVVDPRGGDAKHCNVILDHRCPHHGEKAQPALWGRHRDKELLVTWAQWDSLGVAYTPADEGTKQPFPYEQALERAKAAR